VNDPLCQAVEAAWQAGIVVVVAAGNEGRNNSVGNNGYGTIMVPGNDPYVITVGAMRTLLTSTRTDDLVTSYSSKGPTLIDHIVKPDLVAPGNLTISVEVPNSTLSTAYPLNSIPAWVYLNGYSNAHPHNYFVLSGTSMAAPVVSAAAAAMLQKDSTLSPDVIKARLMKTASKSFPVSSTAVDPSTLITYTSYYDVFTIGAGYLDTSAALSSNDSGSGRALSPTANFNSSTNTATMSLTGTSVIWGSSVTWGTGVIWGTNVFVGGTSVIWGTSGSWSSMTPAASSVIWGSTTAAASSVIWGSSTAAALTSVLGDQ
jgi:serine protease AprX